ncbi:MAG: prolipoprotein diacylglyceryl transferase [Proteobacteria bacterium]|nr:prolipoprotein diacylglyceryl transferase [Pseudomonadota bacterium]
MNEANRHIDTFWTHDLSPIFFHLGPFEVRYYGILFAAMLVIGSCLWRSQILRAGRDEATANAFLWMAIAGIIVGGHLGSTLFYEPWQFILNPMQVFTHWRSGFASHGAAMGLLAALWIFSRRYKMPMLEACDRLSIAIPLGTSCIRLGNFFNAEIVGRPTDIPWAIIFSSYDKLMGLPPTPRHPTQIYEMLVGIIVFVLLYIVDRKLGERRPHGLMAGLFLAGYFSLRFFLEFFKEYQVLSASFPLTMGQILSIPFIIAGMAILIKHGKGFSCLLHKEQ